MNQCLLSGTYIVTCYSSEAQNLCHVPQNVGGKIIKCCRGEMVVGGSYVQHKLFFWEENKEKVASCKTVIFKIVDKIIMKY
jgi:hypothetical protein